MPKEAWRSLNDENWPSGRSIIAKKSSELKVRVRVSVTVNLRVKITHVVAKRLFTTIMKIGPSEAVIQKKVFLRCGSHSDTNLPDILLRQAKLCPLKHWCYL